MQRETKLARFIYEKKKIAKFLYLEVYHEVISRRAIKVQYLQCTVDVCYLEGFVPALFAKSAFLIHARSAKLLWTPANEKIF